MILYTFNLLGIYNTFHTILSVMIALTTKSKLRLGHSKNRFRIESLKEGPPMHCFFSRSVIASSPSRARPKK